MLFHRSLEKKALSADNTVEDVNGAVYIGRTAAIAMT
jgi:hypothetical protein